MCENAKRTFQACLNGTAAGGGAHNTEQQHIDSHIGFSSTLGKDLVAPFTLDNTLASICYEPVELIDILIERSQATTHGLIMSQFERLSASLEQPHGQPPQPPTADNRPSSRGDRSTTFVYEPDPYIFDDEHPRHVQFYDIKLSRSLRAQGLTSTPDGRFSEFKREYIS
jgi:hypothetical protein